MKLSDARKKTYKPALFDDIDVVITASEVETHHFEPSDYNPEGSDVVQHAITWKSDDDKELEQSYRIGPAEYITITDDGASFDLGADSKGLREDGEFVHLCNELENAGFPMAELDEDKRGLKDGLVGCRFHIKAETVLDEEGKPRKHTSKKNNKEYNVTKIYPTKFISAPWDAKKGSKGTGKQTAGKKNNEPQAVTPPAEETTGDVKQELADMILEAVAAGAIAPGKLIAPAVRKFKSNDKDRSEALKLLKDQAFLKSIDGVKFDGKELALDE